MSEIRAVANTTAATPRRPLPAGNAGTPAKGAASATDSFVSTLDDGAKALAALNEAAALPAMPTDAAGKQAWLADGYARLTRMELAVKTLRGLEDAGKLDRGVASQAVFKQFDVQRALRQADPDRAAEHAYYAGLAKPAMALIADFKLAPAPSTAVGQKAWLASAQGKLQRAEAARAVVEDAWMHGGASFDDLGKVDDQLFTARCQVDAVKHKLYPPKPGAKPATGSGSYPLFGATQGVSKVLEHQDPVSQTAGAVALPFAVMFDMLDLISRPFQALDKLK
jgi:hypothetical protein